MLNSCVISEVYKCFLTVTARHHVADSLGSLTLLVFPPTVPPLSVAMQVWAVVRQVSRLDPISVRPAWQHRRY